MDNLTQYYEIIIAHFGDKAQKQKSIEEQQELICELYNDLTGRGSRDGLISEISDNYNMLDQLCKIYNIKEEVERVRKEKLDRTIRRIEGSGE